MRRGSSTLATVLLVLSCNFITGESWERADEFVAQLRCGLSLQEVVELAEQYRSIKVLEHDEPGWANHLVRRKNTTISLFVGREGLELVSRSDVTGMQRVRVTPRRNLCTGEATIELSIIAPKSFEGAGVFLDGDKLGAIPPSLLTTIRVPLGEHEVGVQSPGGASAVIRLQLDEQSAGLQRWEIGQRVLESPERT